MASKKATKKRKAAEPIPEIVEAVQQMRPAALGQCPSITSGGRGPGVSIWFCQERLGHAGAHQSGRKRWTQ
jgi:hypothetical protein